LADLFIKLLNEDIFKAKISTLSPIHHGQHQDKAMLESALIQATPGFVTKITKNQHIHILIQMNR